MEKRKHSILEDQKGAKPISSKAPAVLGSIASKPGAGFSNYGTSKRPGHTRPYNTENSSCKQ